MPDQPTKNQRFCWCVEYMRADGSGCRWEYFLTEERARSYCEGSARNGASVRFFKMAEVL